MPNFPVSKPTSKKTESEEYETDIHHDATVHPPVDKYERVLHNRFRVALPDNAVPPITQPRLNGVCHRLSGLKKVVSKVR